MIHLAAQAGVRYSRLNPNAYVDSNLVGFENVLEGCRQHPVQHLVYTSSSSVYGGNTRMPFAERDNVDHPVSLYAGSGYGGACFPKDVKALVRVGHDMGIDLRVLTAVEAANDTQKRVLVNKVVPRFGDDLQGRRFALWGLAFKPDTDAMREAPSRVMVHELLRRGAAIRAYDPVAMDEAQRVFGDLPWLSCQPPGGRAARCRCAADRHRVIGTGGQAGGSFRPGERLLAPLSAWSAQPG